MRQRLIKEFKRELLVGEKKLKKLIIVAVEIRGIFVNCVKVQLSAIIFL